MKTFTLPSLPVSSNRLHNIDHRRRRVFVSDEARQWANRIWPLIPRFDPEPDSIIRVDRCYYYPWFHKNGKWRRVDTSNMDKLLFDVIARCIGVDDLFFKCGFMDSMNSPDERVEITLTEILEDTWRNKTTK